MRADKVGVREAWMSLEAVRYGLGVASGGLVGCTLGLFGGGGSIMAVPLMVYVVGVSNAHVAIGTSALAVATNAASCLLGHAKAGTVKWRFAGVYSAAGVLGALAGSTIGKAIDGKKLLLLFALLMLVVGARMLRARSEQGDSDVAWTREAIAKVLGLGGITGMISGFFGIGGGFLIVPGLIASTGMPIINAIGSSLVAVFAFGVTTALSYAFSGLVDWPLAAAFILGGIIGGQVGAMLACRMAERKGLLNTLFACLIFVVAAGMIAEGISRL